MPGRSGLTTSVDDKTLTRRLLAGDEPAFEEFFNDYFPRLFRFALPRVGGDEDAAEEATQAALVKAMEKLHTFRGEAALFTWLCAIPGYLEEQGSAYFVSHDRNLARLPSYARLDLRANRIFNYDRRRLTLFVEVLNVLNRTNSRPSGYFVRTSGEALGVTETLFPILPSAGILIEF
jgi:hypothetical protein